MLRFGDTWKCTAPGTNAIQSFSSVQALYLFGHYLELITNAQGLPLSVFRADGMVRVRSVTLCGLILASKIWDDLSM